MPHRREQHPDPDAATLAAEPEALEYSLDDRIKAESLVDVLFGRKPHLGIDHVVGGEILGTLGRNTHQ